MALNKTENPSEMLNEEKVVIKRDKTKQVQFNVVFIKKAITAASDNTFNKADKLDKDEITKLAEEVAANVPWTVETVGDIVRKSTTVEDVQDKVIETLKAHGHLHLAEEYIRFREKRTFERLKDAKFMKDIKKKLHPNKKKTAKQNANLDELSFGGRKGEAESTMLKYLARNELMRQIDVDDWDMNRRYPHDSDSYLLGMHNCMSCPIDPLLEKGFNTRQTDIRPAGSVNTAFQLLAVIFQLQSLQQFGGVSATHLDVSMIPYFRMSYFKHYVTVADIIPFINAEKIKKNLGFDKIGAKKVSVKDPRYIGRHWWNFIRRYISRKALILTKKELKQAVEGMYHNLNTLQSRSGKSDCPAA